MKKFNEIHDRVTAILASELPNHLVYHNLVHTKYVLDKSILIAREENINGNELSLIKIAALYHDIGFIKNRDNHEELGCEIAHQDLPHHGFSKEEIDQICGMIMATKIPQSPNNHLEKIIADADLEYLGTERFELVSEKLYKELKHFNNALSRKEWYSIQVNFLSAHQYHTLFCKEHREPIKNQNLEKVKSLLKEIEENELQ
jgi:uncharacterized protein